MKRYILSLILSVVAIFGYAWDFEYQGIKYDILSDNTCQTAAGDGKISTITEEVWEPAWIPENNWSGSLVFKGYRTVTKYEGNDGPNSFAWKNPGEIPSYAEYQGKQYKVIGIGDYSFIRERIQTLNLILPPTLEYIGKGAFAFNTQGQMLAVLPLKNLKSIGDYAFYGSTWFKGGYIFENIDYIGISAFEGQDNLSNITFTNVKEFGKNAFYNCNFETITFNGKTEKIGDYAFYNCERTTKIVLSENTIWIGDYAFANCRKLNELTVPDACKRIGNYAFYDCNELYSLDLGKGVEEICDYAFANCTALNELTVPDACKRIGNYAFSRCNKLCPLDLGKGVEEIGDYAFWDAHYDCSHILELPASLKKIGVWAFMFNRTANGNRENTITDIYIHTSIPPELPTDENGMTAFGDFDPKLHFWDFDGWWMMPFLCLHVPIGSYEAYANDPYWGKFSCIMDDLIPSDPGNNSRKDEDPLTYITDYIYMIPGETINLTDVLYDKDLPTELTWKKINELDTEGIITVTGDGNVQANKFGNAIVIAERDGNKTWVGGQDSNVDSNIAGAVIIFVCPTMTVVYDKNNYTDQIDGTSKTYAAMLGENSTGESADSAEVLKLEEENSTYTHPIVYNSYPKVQINPTPSIEIEVIESAKMDNDNNYVENGELAPIQDIQRPMDDEYTGAVLPINPIVENRVLVVSVKDVTPSLTEVKKQIINDKIYITTRCHFLEIHGADELSTVNIVNLDGQTIYSGTKKRIELQTGIYIVSVEDVVLKAIVR